jgi:cytidylate kinase
MRDVITIDGPSGSGKSTVSKILAKNLGYRYLDTGALYRAVAWKIRDEDIDPDDEEGLRTILKEITISFKGEKTFVNGIDVTSAIREPEIGELSSRVSAMPLVREHLFTMQRDFGLKGKAVIEGRDIGTAILPEAENKFYLDAGIEERARRRKKELKGRGVDIDFNATLEAMNQRDTRDSTRVKAPLKKTPDMMYIDTSNLSIEDVVSKIMEELKAP